MEIKLEIDIGESLISSADVMNFLLINITSYTSKTGYKCECCAKNYIHKYNKNVIWKRERENNETKNCISRNASSWGRLWAYIYYTNLQTMTNITHKLFVKTRTFLIIFSLTFFKAVRFGFGFFMLLSSWEIYMINRRIFHLISNSRV